MTVVLKDNLSLKVIIFGLVISFVFFLMLILNFRAKNCLGKDVLFLQVVDCKSEDLIIQRTIDVGDSFYIAYTHSTAKTTIEEHFLVEGEGNILLTHSVFSSVGFGIPDLPNGENIFFASEDCKCIVNNLQKRFVFLENIRVAFLNPFYLCIGSEKIALDNYAKGRLVNIFVSKVKFIK